MLKKIVITTGLILILVGAGFFGVIIIYDKQDSYCANKSQEILGDRWASFVTPTEDEINKFRLYPPIYDPIKKSVNLGYLEFLKCKNQRNLFELIQNREIMQQKIY